MICTLPTHGNLTRGGRPSTASEASGCGRSLRWVPPLRQHRAPRPGAAAVEAACLSLRSLLPWVSAAILKTRHGITALRPDVNASEDGCTLEHGSEGAEGQGSGGAGVPMAEAVRVLREILDRLIGGLS